MSPPLTVVTSLILKLLRNIVKEPESVKFMNIRMSYPKINEAVGEVIGGVELLILENCFLLVA